MRWVRHLRRRYRRPPRQLKTTREGKLLIAITLGLGFGAINSGNNLLYLILGMLLSLIVVSGVLSELTLRRLRVDRTSKGSPHAGGDVFTSYAVFNEKRRAGSFSVEIEEAFDATKPVHQRPGYSLFLRPGERHEVAARLRFGRRGVYTSTGIRVATRFPFSFFRKWREFDGASEFVVYPAIVPIKAPRLYNVESGAYESYRKVGQGGEYYGLREHRLEDDPRDIHWKTSAKLGRLVSREYEATADRRVWLYVPNVYGEGEQPNELPRETPESVRFETGLSHAASLAAHYIKEGWAVGLLSLNEQIPPETGSNQLTRIYDSLARLKAIPKGGEYAFDAVLARQGERVLVPCTESVHEAVQGEWDWVYDGVNTVLSDATTSEQGASADLPGKAVERPSEAHA